ncbi:MAG: c-type cytochrome [Polaromonas sp.]|uniref:c-type cytochrome n=1 Tax=Polaromonas sp. TaxID=1869339 RepID=UPI0027323E73|nr:c-type cytochrome [Polaromonas sp.]MDP2819336.1 c-type cytochrome [Polaromonas sp.]
MSANDHTTAHEEDHSGPIKTPQQLLAAIFFSFVVPIFAIIALVYYVTSDKRPPAGAVNVEKAVAQRIQKIGMVEIRDANRPLKAGAEVYAVQCAACHTAGVANAPKLGDAASWGPRIRTGYEALLTSALKGKGAMAAQGGGDFEDAEIGRAVVHMANSAGAKFAEPQRAAAVAAAPDSAAPAAGPSPDVMTAVAAANKTAAAPAAAPTTVAGAVPALYTQACAACHIAGVANAPKLADKAAWAPRVALGVDALTASVIKGKGAMPPRGGSTGSDADIKAVVQYMVSTVK